MLKQLLHPVGSHFSRWGILTSPVNGFSTFNASVPGKRDADQCTAKIIRLSHIDEINSGIYNCNTLLYFQVRSAGERQYYP